MMKAIALATCAALCLCWGAFAGEAAKPKAEATSKPEAAAPAPEKKAPELGPWDGFRGIKWGADLSTLSGFTTLGPDPESAARMRSDALESIKQMNIEAGNYVRKGDQLSVGAAKLAGIDYQFYKGKLLRVTLTGADGSFDALKKVSGERYGTNVTDVSTKDKASYRWKGVASFGGEVTLEVSKGRKTGEVFGNFTYIPLEKEQFQSMVTENKSRESKEKAELERKTKEGAKKDF